MQRSGLISTAIAIVDLGGVAILFASAYLLSTSGATDAGYAVGAAGLAAFFAFPVFAAIGLIFGGIALLRPADGTASGIAGITLNFTNILLWIAFVFYQITFNANRFRL